MRLIDADKLMANAEYKGKYDILTAYDVVAAPTIDAVPVVRCRECKYSHLTYDGECKYCDQWAEEHDVTESLYLPPDFYCAWGQRREDGDA